MAGQESPQSGPTEAPDYNVWAKELATVFTDIEGLEQAGKLLQWMHNPEEAKKIIKGDELVKIRELVEKFKKAEGGQKKLQNIIDDPKADPEYKRAVKELLDHVLGAKDTLAETQPDQETAGEMPAPEGGVPIGPPAKPDEAEKSDQDQETETAENEETELDRRITAVYFESIAGKPVEGEQLDALMKWTNDPAEFIKSASDPEKKIVKDFIEAGKSDPAVKARWAKMLEDPKLGEEEKKFLQVMIDHNEGKKDVFEADYNFKEKDLADSKKGTEGSEGFKSDAEKAKKIQQIQEIGKFQRDVKKMGLGALLEEIFKIIARLKDSAKSYGNKLLGQISSKARFTDKQLNEANLDFNRVNEQEPLQSENRNVEYVAKVLNLPVRQDAETFRQSLLATPNCVETKERNLAQLKIGDTLFFHDGQDKEKAAVTAVVSNITPPPKMKIVHETDKVQEVPIQTHKLFNQWLGYIRLPEKQAGAPAPGTE